MNTIILELSDSTMLFITWATFVFGSIGNFLTFKIYSSKKMRKNNLSLYFRATSAIGNILMLIMLNVSWKLYFNESLEYVHILLCKSIFYIAFSVGSMVAWLMVVISIDRFINIAFPKKLPFLSKKTFQLVIIILIIVYDLSFYSFMLWNYDLSVYNVTDLNTNETRQYVECINYAQQTLSWMDLFNSTLAPFFFMFIFTVLLIYYIKKTRTRVSVSLRVDKERKKDRKFTITALTLNVIFLILNLPVVIFNLMSSYNIIVDPRLSKSLLLLTLTIFNIFYGIDFYAQFFSNSIFRDKFLELVGYKLTKIAPGQQIGSISLTQTQTKQDKIDSA